MSASLVHGVSLSDETFAIDIGYLRFQDLHTASTALAQTSKISDSIERSNKEAVLPIKRYGLQRSLH